MENVMNNNYEKKDNELLRYSIFGGLGAGSSTEYTISEGGIIKLTIAYGYASMDGPITVTIEDHLTPDEIALIRDFIKNEIDGKDYRSDIIMDYGETLQAGGREFQNCRDLNVKFLDVLNRIVETHRVFSNDSINPLFDQMSMQFQEKMDAQIKAGVGTKNIDKPVDLMDTIVMKPVDENNDNFMK